MLQCMNQRNMVAISRFLQNKDAIEMSQKKLLIFIKGFRFYFDASLFLELN